MPRSQNALASPGSGSTFKQPRVFDTLGETAAPIRGGRTLTSMSPNNLGAVAPPVNPSPSLDDVCTWTTVKSERGEIPPTSARLKLTSLRQLTSVLGSDEPREAAWVLENLRDIARRWATLNSSRPETARTYESRARGALEDYLAWIKDPTGFKFKRTPQRTEKDEKPQAKAQPVQSTAFAPPAPPPVATPSAFRAFPLGTDRGDFVFQFPPGGITSRDAKKIACHLFTLATDFDLGDAAQASVFSMVAAGVK
jgi:hypothetical protein